MPKPVDRYFKEIKEDNPSYSDAQAWATAWSIYCKHKNPGSDSCHKPSAEYLKKNASAVRVARRFMAIEVGLGDAKPDLSYQGGFPKTTECVKCGKKARLALTLSEDREKDYITNHPPDDDGFWVHDAAAFAIYFCPDVKCATATTIWDQA